MGTAPGFESELAKAYPGLIYDLQPHRIISKFIEAGSILAGAAVSRGPTDKNKIVRGGTTVFGIAVRDHIEGQNSAFAVGDNIRYNPNNGDIAPVMVKGWVWVTSVSGTGVPGDPVWSDDTTGEIGIGTPGIGQTAIANASLQNTITGGAQMALIRLRGNTN